MDSSTLDYEFLRPLCTAWLAKMEQAKRARKDWKGVADDCMMFYSQSAQAMWDPTYSKKFWKGVKAPRFRITINKAFEMVAVFGPNLMWEIPHRKVEPKKAVPIPPGLFGDDPQVQVLVQQMMMHQQQEDARDKIVSHLMASWLNYTPREQPAGGLESHSERAKIDALIKGRGCLAVRPYKMPGSDRQLTGSFYVDPFDLYLDPDFNSVDECRWMAIRHIEPHYEVEERFQLPRNSLRNRATLESSWSYSERLTDDEAASRRQAGQTADNIIWYEIYSKGGVGCRSTSMESSIRDHLEEVVGRYAYIAVCPDVPYPLNMPSEKIRSGSVTDDEVREAFQWPVPFWRDDRWPVEMLDFYHNPSSAWPIAPMAPGLGELKLLNFLVSWMANRTWKSSRDFWAVASPHVEHYREYLLNGEDQAIVPTPLDVDDLDKAIKVLQQPETRQDLSELIQFVSDMFDKRVGLTAPAYGLNADGTQNRTAEETLAKSRAVNVRPESMQKKVVGWQSRIAQSEAFVTRMFVGGNDVLPLVGPIGAHLWEQHVSGADIELITRQFQYTIEASSIRRPNRDRDIGNYQTVLAQFMPIVQQYGQSSGNYEPFNYLMQKWAEYHDADLDGAAIPSPEPPTPEQMQRQEQLEQLQVEQLAAEVQRTQAETQAKLASAQPDLAEQMKVQAELERDSVKAQAELQLQQVESEQDLAIKQRTAEMTLLQDAARHEQEMQQDRERHAQEMILNKQKADAAIQQAKAMAAAKPKPASKPASANKPAGSK